MRPVWLLHHVHEFEDRDEDVKLIGVFATRDEADAARRRVADQPGFRDFPDSFSIDEAELGIVGWLEGYVTIERGDGVPKPEPAKAVHESMFDLLERIEKRPGMDVGRFGRRQR